MNGISRSRGTLLLLVVLSAAAIVAILGTRASAGPLDPSGGTAPTGKTLEEIPGSWSRALPANDGSAGPNPPAGCNSTRFACVLGDEAVLDRETGLVWQQAPDAGTSLRHLALRGCLGAGTGGRMGWRLPSLEEVRSLLDLEADALPAGHPFGGDGTFWTSTTVSDAPTQAYVVFTGNPTATLTAVKLDASRRIWCVRGGAGYDASQAVPPPP